MALAGLPAAAQGPGDAAPRLARVAYTDKAQLTALDAAGWDIWEVHPDYAVAVPPRGTAPQALPAGVTVPDLGPLPPAAFDAGYHTYTEMLAAMRTVVGHAHPSIVTLFDIGDGWEKTKGLADRDIWAVRVASRPGPGAAARAVRGRPPTPGRSPPRRWRWRCCRCWPTGYGARPAAHLPGGQPRDLDRAHGQPRRPRPHRDGA